MRRRLILSTALIALAAVIVLGVPLGIVDAARLRQDSTSRLEHEADAVAGAIDDRLERRPAGQPGAAAPVHPGRRTASRSATRGGRRITTGPPIGGEALRARAGAPLGGSVIAEAPIGSSRAGPAAWLLIAALSLGGVPSRSRSPRCRRAGWRDRWRRSRAARRSSATVTSRSAPGLRRAGDRRDRAGARLEREPDRGLVAREREFSANVSHQLRTPLTALRLRLEGAARAARTARERELEAALHEADRLEATIADLLAHARQAARALPSPSMSDGAHEHADALAAGLRRRRRSLEVVRRARPRASRGRSTRSSTC